MARRIRKLPPAARYDGRLPRGLGRIAAALRAGLRRAAGALGRGLRGPLRAAGRVASGAALRRPRASAALFSTGLLGLALWHTTPEAFWTPPATPRLGPDAGRIRALEIGPAHIGAGGLDCRALNIYHEARGEPEEGRVAVAQVVLNRVLDSRFPNTICAVVKQGARPSRRDCQFSWWCDGRDDRPANLFAWEQAKVLAGDVLAGRRDDPTGGALWYHAERAAPKWREAFTPARTIGRHRFYLPVSGAGP